MTVDTRITRRGLLAGASAVGLMAATGTSLAQTPAKITPELIAAAQKEGKVVVYTSVEVQIAEKVAKAFEARFPGVKVQVERSGSERILQRLGQEYSSRKIGRAHV